MAELTISLDIRALDAEKKALVYDNYSKLIAATETIRKMRSNMDPLNPMASTLDPAIAHIYDRANTVKQELSASMGDEEKQRARMGKDEIAAMERRRRAAKTAGEILDVPERVRRLVQEGEEGEARELWEKTVHILQKWKQSSQGGVEVQYCIDDGEAALKGELPGEKSWVNIKAKS